MAVVGSQVTVLTFEVVPKMLLPSVVKVLGRVTVLILVLPNVWFSKRVNLVSWISMLVKEVLLAF